MLVAECRGKTRSEVEDDEDYLTSSIFGHLRYVSPDIFWKSLFNLAKGVDASETSLGESLRMNGISVEDYSSLSIQFWPYHTQFGEPDMILSFSGKALPNLAILIEVKLWSMKSNAGDRDQLANYLRLMETLEADCAALVYLTPRDSLAEVEDTLQRIPDRENARQKIFRLQWQDVLSMAKECAAKAPEPAKTILTDVCKFLKRRGLEYFGGYQRLETIALPGANEGTFYESIYFGGFSGMKHLPSVELFSIKRAGWVR